MNAGVRTAWVQGWLEMVGEKKPLGMSELGCADGCGRQMVARIVAGDERAWLRGRVRTGNGCGDLRGQLRRIARTVADGRW